MSYILTISGSARTDSTNRKLLRALDLRYELDFDFFDIHSLPLFRADRDQYPWPEQVLLWRNAVAQSSAILITTPAYLQNLPAALKSALEWLTTSGELDQKKVLPITYTSHPPRGENAMTSLLWCLLALNARIVTQLPLYQSELQIDKDLKMIGDEVIELLDAAIELVI